MSIRIFALGLWAVSGLLGNFFGVATWAAPNTHPDPQTIALIAGLTGSDPNTAREIERGMRIFLKLHPEFAGRFAPEVIDNQGDPAKTIEVMQAAIKRGTRIFIGIANSDEAIAGSTVAEKSQAILITPFATNPKVTAQKKYTFRACYSDDRQGQILARFAGQELKPARVAVLTNRDSHYSQGLSENFIEALKKRFPKIVLFQRYYSKTDYRWPELKIELTADAPELVFIPDHVTHAGILTKHISEEFPAITLLGGDGWGGKKVLQAIHESALPNRTFYSTHWDEALEGEVSARFVSAYRASYPDTASVSTGAALSYDAFALIAQAVKDWPGPKRDPQLNQLLRRLESTEAQGVGGTIGYRPRQDHTPNREVVMIVIRKGKHEVHRRFGL